MSYPTGSPGGYSGQQPQQSAPVFGQPPRRPNPLGSLGLPTLLSGVVAVLALISYFCSFSASAAGLNLEVIILLGGGLLAALDLLPKTPDTLPFAALLSTVGGLAALAAVIQGMSGTVPAIDVIIMVFAVLQLLVSVFALLLDHEIVKLAPRSAVPFSAQQTTFTNTGPGSQQFPAQPGGNQQATTHVPYAQAQPPNPRENPQPQPTAFMQHPGQLGQPGHTPPGGIGGSPQS